jgi:hypothetical protein
MTASLRIAAFLLLGTCTTGYAMESADQFFTKPGRFDYQTCPELAAARKRTEARAQELKTLTERAERDPFGGIIAMAAYSSDVLRIQGEQKALAELFVRKECPPDTKPTPPAAKKAKPASAKRKK